MTLIAPCDVSDLTNSDAIKVTAPITTAEQWATIPYSLLTERATAVRVLIKERRGMGILNMSPLDWATRVTEFSQTSLENTLDTIKEVHQTMAEIPINVAQELGMSRETGAALKYVHRRVLDHIHTGVRDAVGEVNQFIVKQVQNVDRLANFDRVASAATIVAMESKKEQPEERKLN